jgi:DNA-directed RNA polymerase subunit RPC12/RpoP
MFRCPGQDMRRLTVSYHPCPNCGKPVEFFSDEMRIRCPNCKTIVHKESAPSCIQWCKAARDCLGPELYDQLVGKLQEHKEDQEE